METTPKAVCYVLLCCAMLFTFATPMQGQEIGNIEGTLLKFPFLDTLPPNAHAVKAAQEMATLLKYLKEQEQKEKRFNGNARFGFAGDKTDAASLYKLNAGITVSRGYYPDKFEFANDVGLVLNNGTFRENVSNMFITYDHSLMKGDSLFLEDYMVMSRFSDEFLGIEQRYELGGGFIIAFWSKKMTATGRSQYQQLTQLGIVPPNNPADSLSLCIDGNCRNYALQNPQDNEAQQLYRARQLAKVALRKKYNKFRMALLSGLIVEVEKAFATDSLLTTAGKQQFTQSFDASLHLRWELRPTIDLRPTENWALKIRPYFKMPMPWEWYSRVSNYGYTSKAIDYRLDVQTSLSIKLAEWINKQASVELQYRILYDNAPRRTYLNPILSPDAVPLLLKAQHTHHIIRLMFQVGF